MDILAPNYAVEILEEDGWGVVYKLTPFSSMCFFFEISGNETFPEDIALYSTDIAGELRETLLEYLFEEVVE